MALEEEETPAASFQISRNKKYHYVFGNTITKCYDDAGKSDVKSSDWILFIYVTSSQLCLESGSMFVLWHTTLTQDILVHLSFNLFYNSVSLHFCPIWQLASMLSMFLFSSNSISFSFRWSFCRIFPSVLNSTFKKKENPYSWNWKGGHTISNNWSIIGTNDVNKVEVGRKVSGVRQCECEVQSGETLHSCTSWLLLLAAGADPATPRRTAPS